MRFFGVNVIYDRKETLKTIAEYKDKLPHKKLRKLRYYEVTNEFDRFRKYCFAFGFWGVLRIHFQTVLKYWFIDRPKYLRYLNMQC